MFSRSVVVFFCVSVRVRSRLPVFPFSLDNGAGDCAEFLGRGGGGGGGGGRRRSGRQIAAKHVERLKRVSRVMTTKATFCKNASSAPVA